MERFILNTLGLSLVFILCSCQKDLNYNPFDSDFYISVPELLEVNHELIPAGCGYYNIVERDSNPAKYCQIYLNDFGNVVAKGFHYAIDTIDARNLDLYERRDSLESIPVSIQKVNSDFLKYGLKYLSKSKGTLNFSRLNEWDSICLELNLFHDQREKILIRSLNYFNGKKEKE